MPLTPASRRALTPAPALGQAAQPDIGDAALRVELGLQGRRPGSVSRYGRRRSWLSTGSIRPWVWSRASASYSVPGATRTPAKDSMSLVRA